MAQNSIKASEISEILLQQLKGIDTSVQYEEIGQVLQVSDGVARVYGLAGAEAGELLEFDSGVNAVVMNLEEDNVGAVLLGPTDLVKEGMKVRRLGKIAGIPVGEEMLGRVVNALGEPIDGCGPIRTYFQVVFPMLRPTMISVGILEIMWVWNDYLLPYLIFSL